MFPTARVNLFDLKKKLLMFHLLFLEVQTQLKRQINSSNIKIDNETNPIIIPIFEGIKELFGGIVRIETFTLKSI